MKGWKADPDHAWVDADREWRVSPSFPEYEVSDLGQVRKIETGRVLMRRRSPLGYLMVHVRKGGKSQTQYVHTLVADAFLGPCPEGCEVNHKDGNRANPAAANLEYISHSENIAHGIARRKGTPDRPDGRRPWLHKPSGHWCVWLGGRRRYLGRDYETACAELDNLLKQPA